MEGWRGGGRGAELLSLSSRGSAAPVVVNVPTGSELGA